MRGVVYTDTLHILCICLLQCQIMAMMSGYDSSQNVSPENYLQTSPFLPLRNKCRISAKQNVKPGFISISKNEVICKMPSTAQQFQSEFKASTIRKCRLLEKLILTCNINFTINQQ